MATFQIQQFSSTVNWTGKKVLGLHTGTIKLKGGQLERTELNTISGEVEMDMTSIVISDIEDPKTNADFLAHLQNDDFFATDKFKTAQLVVHETAPLDGNSYEFKGNLTIKDITHPVVFRSTVEVFTDFLHAMGEITIDRTLYNIRYGSGKFIENLGDKLIYDDFVLQFKIVAQKSN